MAVESDRDVMRGSKGKLEGFAACRRPGPAGASQNSPFGINDWSGVLAKAPFDALHPAYHQDSF